MHKLLLGFEHEQNLALLRDPVRRDIAQAVLWTRFIGGGVGFAITFVVGNVIGNPDGIGVVEALLALVVLWALFGWLCMYYLETMIGAAVIGFILITPIAAVSYLLLRLYYDVQIDTLLDPYWRAAIHGRLNDVFLYAAGGVIVTAPLVTWGVTTAQPFISWSVAGFARRVIEALIGLRLMPVAIAILLWVFAPVIGQYVPDGAFWARIGGVAWLAFKMPSILWKIAEGILTGLDRMAKARRTRGQNIYGDEGFADPAAAASAMARGGYD